MSTPISASQKLVAIQCLRGIAVMMVVWVHTKEQFRAFGEYFVSPIGANGVDLFFVISGFIMVYTTHGKNISVPQFLWRRAARIVPLYWTGTLAMAVAALVVPHLLKSTTFNTAHLLASLLFVPWPSPTLGGQLFPVLVPGWSINYEMYFYAIFAFALWAPVRYRLVLLAVLLLVAQAASSLVGGTIAEFYGDSIVLEFLAGAIIGVLHQKSFTPRTWKSGWVFIVAGLLYWWTANEFGSWNRFTGAGLAAALVVLGSCSLSPPNTTGIIYLQRLGDSSFSIYIFHIFLLGVLRLVWTRLSLPTDGAQAAWAFMTSSLLLNAVVGQYIYKTIESLIAKKIDDLTWPSIKFKGLEQH